MKRGMQELGMERHREPRKILLCGYDCGSDCDYDLMYPMRGLVIWKQSHHRTALGEDEPSSREGSIGDAHDELAKASRIFCAIGLVFVAEGSIGF